jgi:hypothetical protein
MFTIPRKYTLLVDRLKVNRTTLQVAQLVIVTVCEPIRLGGSHLSDTRALMDARRGTYYPPASQEHEERSR